VDYPLSRRQLLRLGIPAAAWAAFGTGLHADDTQDRDVDVLVIGAGASGLAAARELSPKYRVVVLEARDRIGGRVWSDRPWGDVTLDMGASWIHGIRGNPIHTLAQQLKIETHATSYEKHWLYGDNGHEYEDPEQAATEARAKKLLAELRAGRKQALSRGEPDISLQAALDRLIAGRPQTPLQLHELNYQLNSLVEQEYAADTNELSYLYYERGEDFEGQDVLFPHGYGQITRHLAEGLKIKLKHQVRRLEWDQKQGVTVATNQGQFKAKFAVITLPLGVLQRGSVEFAPALPAAKQHAISHLGMGLMNKTYLRFPRQFWPPQADWIGMVSTPKGRWAEYINVARFVPQPILLGFNVATFARRLERHTDEQTIAGMVAALRSMFGRKVPDPTDAKITRWGSDPFSLGSYSFLKTGSTPQDYDHLAAPVGGRLFFAGEHTNRRYAATVHGAYLSGLRAARQVAAQA